MMAVKKTTYIAAFTALGILLQFVIHGAAEIWYIGLLVGDFSKYGLGFSWEQWFCIHAIFTVILFVAGAAFGFWQGVYWWRVIYVEKRRR
jgi:hypothetical protein